jgi:hypothetical protein
MRLAIATTILAESLPFVSSASLTNDHTNPIEDPHLVSVHFNEQQLIHVAERNQFRKGDYLIHQQQQRQQHYYGGIGTLKNKKGAVSSTVIECTTLSSANNSNNVDVGILSCGIGKYCMESTESSLGGYCVNDDENTKRNNNIPGRRRQQVVGQLSIFELADLFCNKPETTGLKLDCNCTVDFEAYSGEFSCYFGPECVDFTAGCEDDTFPLCSTEKLDAIIDSKMSYTYTSCYTQTMPMVEYKFEYCTTFSFNENDGPTCDIVMGGQTCNSW